MTLREDVTPVFEAYTNDNGKFNELVKLPAYAKELYVVTGNYFVSEYLLNAEVKNGAASLVAEGDSQPTASRRAPRRAEDNLTNDVADLYQLSYEVDVNTGDKTNTQVYKEWFTPLGSWDRESGRPAYLMDKTTADTRLLFTEDEMNGLYETVSNALIANQTCSEQLRMQADLTLVKESEVAVSFLGSKTCWNNTLGYYYYNETDKPTSPMDLNIVMLFPNTQDGRWWRTWCRKPNFYGNIALERGDMVKLMYYPNIANGDVTTATTKFPKGTKIGFILKSNGWGMQKTKDGKKFFNSYNGYSNGEAALARQYNVWASSTDGLSYCNTTGLRAADNPIQNPTGLSRTAKFAYVAPSGEEYAIVGFEDACNDLDYDDIVLALKPADAFSTLPRVEDKKTSSTGVYAYEDLWPAKADYDMNDVMVEATHEKTYSVKSGTDYKIYKQTFSLTTYQNYVELKSGLAVTLNTKVNPSSVVMKKVAPQTNDTTEVSFAVDGKTYLLTSDIKAELGTTYILEVNYQNGLSKLSDAAEIQPFIYRAEAQGRWEVHIPFEAPTNKMITSYFGTRDDKSVPAEGKYFVGSSDYPFAFYLDGITISTFMETLLERSNESVKISDLYPQFLPWSQSKGTTNADWYLHPAVNR
jgi:LruC domain-containing protein